MTQRRPHEARVVAEKTDLDIRLFALTQFLTSPLFPQLPEDEQYRLKRQRSLMEELSKLLGERIAAFPPVIGLLVDGDIKALPITELNPELANAPVFKEAVPIGAVPISNVDTFAMMVDQWHAQKMEQGNRMLEIPEGTEITVEDEKNPGQVIQMNLDGAYLSVFRIGVETVLNIFKDLPFGASIEEAPADGEDADPS